MTKSTRKTEAERKRHNHVSSDGKIRLKRLERFRNKGEKIEKREYKKYL